MRRTKRAAVLSLLFPAVMWAAPVRADGGGGEDLWTGFYLGAQAGYQGILIDPNLCLVTDKASDCSIGNGFNDVDLSGAQLGLYLGYNYRIDNFVFGLEADITGGTAHAEDKQEGYEYEVNGGGDIGLRARLGMLAGERTLLYATGGPSLIGEEIKVTNCSEIYAKASCDFEMATHYGWQLGAGAEYFATDRLSLKAEYLRGWYNSEKMTLVEDESGRIQADNDLVSNTVRLGVAYHFNGR